ncbi:CRISPR system Cascade subunit CasC [Herpetosiphon gulosus]|uniref:CRISPR system Cascade subunit CasC n=2 Tax=Herpetosiphon gulosus TaxID=1973496 RepID=A0ABP9X6Z3_9CHLR
MLIAFHLIQNHAPSNLNRDDNGDPKDTIIGGVRRSRISSQAEKRSMRWHQPFREAFSADVLATRTQLLPEWVRQALQQHHEVDAEAEQQIVRFVESLGKKETKSAGADGSEGEEKPKGKKGKGTDTQKNEAHKTAQLMFLSTGEVERLSSWLVEKYYELGATGFAGLTSNDLIAEIKKKGGLFEPHSVDIAMFGRMTTSSPFKDIEAAVQVAHAFSTHKVETEYDFFTAVDDRSGESGAGMLGEVAFNSATYYKYINIHWEGLLKNLHNDYELATKAVLALLQAAMTAIPSGKQNSFAAHNLADFILVEVLDRTIPVSYANAFVQPIQLNRAHHYIPQPQEPKSLLTLSIQALLYYANQIQTKYELQGQRACFTLPALETTPIQAFETVSSLGNWLRTMLPQREV